MVYRQRDPKASLLWGWDMKKAAQPAARAPISRAQKIVSMQRKLAFMRKLERRLKAQTDFLDAARAIRFGGPSG